MFEALSDPVRRRLLSHIATGPATATELASGCSISRQAVIKHLSSLSSVGLLARERSGRDVRYRITPEPLSDAVRWMTDVGGRWLTAWPAWPRASAAESRSTCEPSTPFGDVS